MTHPEAVRAMGLLIEQAWADYAAGRYGSAISAAGRAVHAAEQADDPGLLVRALMVEASTLSMLGDYAAALVRFTRVLGMAEDPAITAQLDNRGLWAVGKAYIFWSEAARFAGGIAVRKLFGVLDAAERWMTAVGHREWRCGVLLERALTYERLGEWNAAVAAAQEALAIYVADTPGWTLNTHRYQLGDILRDAGRATEAVPLYQAILDDTDARPNDRKVALNGLAWCALDGDDPASAVRHATIAVEVAEALGDNALTTALGVLVAAHRADHDLDAAWPAATRYVTVARRVGTHNRLDFALRAASDVALDRADLDTARDLLDELDEHATTLDNDTGGDTYRGSVTRRRQRLAELTAKP